MHPVIASAVKHLETKRITLDVRYKQERVAISEAIERLLTQERVDVGDPGCAVSTSLVVPSRPRPSAKMPDRPVSDLILEAVQTQSAPFSNADIRCFLDALYPAASATVSGDRISKELYVLRKRGVISITQLGPKGGAHRYQMKHPGKE